ncbi:MAG TPA: hypothetical protein VLE69_01055, partial [Candidatus Saccharimonadales bacterium]|nr:hypothetical protein [Candidatus Saccharimonadales bacterium]
VQKRQRSDGSLVSAWATSGTATINPSSGVDPPTSLVLDINRSLLWVTGGDRTLGVSNMQWYFQPLSIDTGTVWLAAQDTAPAASTSISVRLRLLLHSNTQQFLSGSQNLKLQYSPKSGTCDTAFVGENYTDITTSTEVGYHDNPSVSDATAMVAVSGDPVHSSDPTTLETIEEANDFNPAADVPPAQDGEWDFTLQDNSAFGAYCIRAVYDDGSSTQLNTYTVIPEINFCKDDPRTDNLLRHGTYFCGGLKKSFFWAQ